MDFRISADDRVGGQTGKAGKKRAAASTRGQSSRVEPSMGRSVGVFVDDERSGGVPPNGPKGKAPKPKRGRAKPVAKKKRSRSGGFLMGVLWWGFVACLWGGIAVIGVIVYYGAQLPSSNTWAIPDRPPNIRILAADGSLISNRGATGGEAVTYRELPYYVPAAIIASEDQIGRAHV